MKKLFLIAALSMLACSSATNILIIPTATTAPTLTPTSTPTPAATLTPTATLTAYEKYTIEYLRSRTYGSGELSLVKTVQREKNFTTYLAQYASDGLSTYALISIPDDANGYPVIVTIHGYVHPLTYNLYQDGRLIDNDLAQQGFIVVHPAMRNYPPSDNGDNLFRVGQTIDVLNLIAIIKTQSGQPGLLENANPNRIGIAGLSTGGGVALRILTINADVKAAVLYSSISGDEKRNVRLFQRFAERDPQFTGETSAPDNVLIKISPSSYYSSITAPVLLAHGVEDQTVPLGWGRETCDLLKAAAVKVTCNFYEKAGHLFLDADLITLLSQAGAFFHKYLYD